MKTRNLILWLVLIALSVHAQDLIFKTGFEDGEFVNSAPVIVSSPITRAIRGTLYVYPVGAIDTDGHPLVFTTTEKPTGMSVSAVSGSITWTPGVAGVFPVTVAVADSLGGSDSQSFSIEVVEPGSTTVPPHPATLAPDLDMGETTPIGPSTEFLYTGTDAIQTGVAALTIDPVRAAVMRGRVTERDGSRLAGVTVSILDMPEYGETMTRFDGEFDLVVNGGGLFTVKYQKDGYLPVQRSTGTKWQDYAWLPDIVMIPLDPAVTEIDLTNPEPMQLVLGSETSDEDGSRRPVLMIPNGTTAEMVMPDASTVPISTLSIRATEYTVGENGPQAMPGRLPPNSQYTYAVDWSVDEAVTAGAESVTFSQPLVFYLENFVDFPVGVSVPTGFYDLPDANWKAINNGRVVEVVGIILGKAELDVDGDSIADTGSVLTELGITDEELERLASIYATGSQLWRVQLEHFTPFDCNWTAIPPDGAISPPKPRKKPKPDKGCNGKGSIIDCHGQSLRERVNLVGSPYALNYWSTIPGSRSLLIPLSSSDPGVYLAERILLRVEIAGSQFRQVFEAQPDQAYRFQWNGRDSYGRLLQGRVPVNITTDYVYPAFFTQNVEALLSFRLAWAGGQAYPSSRTGTGGTINFTQRWTDLLGGLDLRSSHALGGWTLSPHHFYDPVGQTLYLGNGEKRGRGGSLPETSIRTIAGNGEYFSTAGTGPPGDDGPAIDAGLCATDIVVAPDGSYFMPCAYIVRKVGTDGIITRFAGMWTPNSQGGYSGDDGPATEAEFKRIDKVELGPDGSLYILDALNKVVRMVDTDGIVTTMVGHPGNLKFDEEGIAATEAQLGFPNDVIATPDGTLYIIDQYCRIRQVTPDGLIYTVAGVSCREESGGRWLTDEGDGGPAVQARLASPSDLALGPDGTLYVTTLQGKTIRAISPRGVITTIAGGPECGSIEDGEPALGACFSNNYVADLAANADGTLYFGAPHKVRTIDSSGLLRTVAGTGFIGSVFGGEDGPARRADMGAVYALDVDANGKLYVIEGPASVGSPIIRRIESPIPGFNAEDILIASMDGNEMYVFAPQGRHKQTVNVLTGAIVHTFNYDGEGRLTSILDGDGNLTTIDRDIDGKPTAIVAPGNQTTTLALNTEGYLQSITNPASKTTSMAYDALGMLKTFTDPIGNTSTFTYDENGLLIENDDGSGGVQTFSRVESQTDYTVTRTTAMGKVTTYRLEYLANGSQRSTVTGSNGDQTIVYESFSGVTEETQSDGTIITRSLGPDPRFGMQSPVPEFLKIEIPNVGTSEITQTRTVVMTDDSNPLSLETLQDDLDINSRVFTDHYDAATRTFTKTSPLGHQVVSVTDEQGRITSLTGAIGLDPETFTYDDKGRLEQKNRGTESITLGYDTKNLPITHTNAAGHMTTYEYDGSNRVSQMTKADGQVLLYDYDANGNQTNLEMPSSDSHVMSFSRRDLRTGYTPPGNAPYTRVYDNDRDLINQSLPGGRTLTNVFDAKRRWIGMNYPEASVDYIYDGARDRLAGLDRTPTSIGAGQQIDYLYYGSLPFRSTWIGAANGRYTYFHNTDLQVSHIQLKISGIPQVDLPVTWDLDGNQTGYGPFALTRGGPGGALSQVSDANLAYDMAYDTLGRLDNRAVKVNSLSVYDFTLTFNNLGKIIGKDETVNGVNHVYVYTYDDNGRLTNVTRDAVQFESFTYDDNDNRTGTLTANSTYDAQDRITSHNGVAHTVDVDGFLSARGPENFQYSTRGELIRVVLPGPTEITYSYDGMGRRVARTDASGTTEYLYGDPRDPLLLTAVRDTAGDLTVLFHHPVAGYYAMQRDGTTYYLATDQVGSPRVVTDTAGSVVKVIEYDSFGKRMSDSNPTFKLHIGYAGGLEDTDTGLVRFGYRDYDQAAGRWTARDPLLYGGGQANLYAYSYNNPVTYKDPSGLWCAAGYLYDIIGGGIEVCCKNGDCSVCAEAGIGIGAGLDAGEGDPKDPGTRPFAEAGAGCGPAGGGMKCEFGGKCGTKCSAEGGVGPFKLNTEDEKGGGVGSGADNGDDGKLGKCGFNAKAGVRDCKRF